MRGHEKTRTHKRVRVSKLTDPIRQNVRPGSNQSAASGCIPRGTPANSGTLKLERILRESQRAAGLNLQVALFDDHWGLIDCRSFGHWHPPSTSSNFDDFFYSQYTRFHWKAQAENRAQAVVDWIYVRYPVNQTYQHTFFFWMRKDAGSISPRLIIESTQPELVRISYPCADVGQ